MSLLTADPTLLVVDASCAFSYCNWWFVLKGSVMHISLVSLHRGAYSSLLIS